MIKRRKTVFAIIFLVAVVIMAGIYIINFNKKNEKQYELFRPIIGELNIEVIGSGAVIPTDIDNEGYNELEFQIEVDEADVPKLEEGMQAEITFNAFEGIEVKGKVKEIALEGDVINDISTFKVILSIEEEVEKLRAGMTGYASILAERKENVMYVPIEGVYTDSQNDYVLIQHNDICEKVIVETGITNDDYIEIKSGLSEENDIQIPMESDINYINKYVPKIFRG